MRAREILPESEQLDLEEGFVANIFDKLKDLPREKIAHIKKKLLEIKAAISNEKAQTKEMWAIYQKYLRKEATPEEIKIANTQFMDIVKAAGLAALLPIPGSSLLIPILVKIAKKFNVELLPDSFVADPAEIHEAQQNLGYKIMRYEDGRAISGADSRQSFIPKVGAIVSMTRHGIYMGTSKDYVLTHYSGLADEEILLTFEFDPNTITVGNLTDREPEIAVPSAKIVNVEMI